MPAAQPTGDPPEEEAAFTPSPVRSKRRKQPSSGVGVCVVVVLLLLTITGVGLYLGGVFGGRGKEEAISEPTKKSPSEQTKNPPAKRETDRVVVAKTAEEARAELQGRINRYLGGQKDPQLLGGLFAIASAFTVFDRIEIETVLQKYDEGGKPLPNEFVATFRASGGDKNTGQPKADRFSLFELSFRGGKWEVR